MEGTELLRQSILRAKITPHVLPPALAAPALETETVDIHEHDSCADEIEVLRARITTLERSFAKLVHSNPAGIEGIIPTEPMLRRPRIHDIKLAIIAHYGFTLNEIDGICRNAPVVHARHIAQHLSRKLTLNGLPEIGRRFGGRDHTSILSADRRIKRLREKDPSFDEELRFLEGKILGTLA